MTLLTVDEAAEQLRCHPVTIRRMIRRGDLAAVKVGSVYRISADDLKPTRVTPQQKPARVDPSPLAQFVQPEWLHQRTGA